MMKHIIALLVISIGLIACKKIPTRSHIKLELVSINNDTTLLNQGIELDYSKEHEFKFSYQSENGLELVHIQLVKHPKEKIDGIDEGRVSPIPVAGNKNGHFTYTVNPSEQCNPPVTTGISIFEFIKIVLIDETGTTAEETVQFKVI